ncbi:hypothetical protein BDZ45DRAFT_305692 [Acephala macrosclerotiorum]|nr:hypothetical protein BDZ45DRAFT_305692 [Acephala macrosclerotiorum]
MPLFVELLKRSIIDFSVMCGILCSALKERPKVRSEDKRQPLKKPSVMQAPPKVRLPAIAIAAFGSAKTYRYEKGDAALGRGREYDWITSHAKRVDSKFSYYSIYLTYCKFMSPYVYG